MNTFIRLLYSLLIAGAVITFVGVSVNTFYPGPTAPAYAPIPDKSGQIDQTQEAMYRKAYDAYQADQKAYSRMVSIVLSVLVAVIMASGLWLRRRADIIGEGLALGGIGTSIYAVVMASTADDRIMRFAAVSVFLAATIVIVYVQFSGKEMKQTPAKAKKR